MRYLLDHGDTPLPPPEFSEKLQPIEIAAESGLLPRPHDPVVREWFLDGTEPAQNAGILYATIDGRFVRVRQGKGKKDRIVPLGKAATAYLRRVRPIFFRNHPGRAAVDKLFVARQRTALRTSHVWHLVRR